jgi:hypothetical protein
MPDISMCLSQTCPLRATCYRFLATPDHYQTYASFKPDEGGNCSHYWPIKTKPDDTL